MMSLVRAQQGEPKTRHLRMQVSCFISSRKRDEIAPPVGLNQTTSRFENVTPVALSDQEKAFSKRHRDARRSVSLSFFARASGANHRRRWGSGFCYVVRENRSPVGLNQTTSRFENVTPVALSNREKAFSRRHRDARRSVSLSFSARASGANHRRRWGLDLQKEGTIT